MKINSIFRKSNKIVTVICLMLLFVPTISYAYIDPGMVGMLFQTVLAFIFGVLLFWFTKPFRYFKNLYLKMKEKSSSKKDKGQG